MSTFAEETNVLNEQQTRIYNDFLDRYINIIRENPSKEILQSMMGVVGEHDSASIVNGSVTNGKGSDVTVQSDNVVVTKSGPISLREGDRVEIKSTYVTINNDKKIRVQQMIGKRGHCDYVLICDYRSDYNRKFLVPAAVFFERALFNDVGYTNSFTWDANYTAKGKYGSNTNFLLEYEIV